MDKGQLKGDFFNLLAFLVTSARNCVEEPKLYGPFRLIDGASRLIEILEQADIADEFLVEIRKKIDDNKYSVMGDKDEFIKFLDNLILDFVDKLKSTGG
ncbi:MAG: hypothetical protein KAV98_01670 [Dehalococcoidia bacterium]|nr:hypothetical protein [Dehalococcoidia bacterium]